MITQTRTFNLKFIGAILFAVTFLVGGFFINAKSVDAVGTTQSFTVSYSLSSVTSFQNNDGGVTTTVFIGCAPNSGDLFDINTGRPCAYITTTVLVGCAPLSGDLYDINTGKRCTNDTKPVLIGCAPKSGDLFDINTGKRCTNDTSVTNTNPILATSKTVDKVAPAKTIVASAPNKDELVVEPIQSVNELVNTPAPKTTLKDSLTANAEKVGSILKGPMSIWIILLILIILLGGGYGIYGLINKDRPTHVWQASKKVEVKKINTEPIIQQKPITPTAQAVTPAITSEPKTTTTQTMPLNIPNNSNPQGQSIKK